MTDLSLESQLRKEIERLRKELMDEKEAFWNTLGEAEKERQGLLDRVKQLERQSHD